MSVVFCEGGCYESTSWRASIVFVNDAEELVVDFSMCTLGMVRKTNLQLLSEFLLTPERRLEYDLH